MKVMVANCVWRTFAIVTTNGTILKVDQRLRAIGEAKPPPVTLYRGTRFEYCDHVEPSIALVDV